MHSFNLEDFSYLRQLDSQRPMPMTWDESMEALAKHRGLKREQLPKKPPSQLR